MKSERIAVYVTDKMVAEARERGLDNISLFFRDRLSEYIATHDRIEGNKV